MITQEVLDAMSKLKKDIKDAKCCNGCLKISGCTNDQIAVFNATTGLWECQDQDAGHVAMTLNADEPTQEAANLVGQELQLSEATVGTFGVVDLSDIVTSVAKSGSAQLKGDVTLSEGANITLTQVGNDISFAVGDPITLNADQPTQDSLNLVGQEVQAVPATTTTYGVVKLEDLQLNIATAANYAALPDPTLNPDTYINVLASQGTKWLPGVLGGTYYSKGFYYSDGISWSFVGEVPWQATQADVDAGIITDQFVSPATLAAATTTGANKALSNLASVAINTDLVGAVAGGMGIRGGSAADDDLILEGTTHATKTSSYVLLQPNGGNVGIGTSTPATALHVAGSGSGTSGRTWARVQNTTANSAAGVQLTNSAGRFGSLQYTGPSYVIGEQFSVFTESDYPIVFSTNANTASGGSSYVSFSPGGYANETARFLGNGRIGIATTAPDRLLHAESVTALTNTVDYPLRLSHITSGTVAANFGIGQEYELENASGTNRVAATEEITWSDATDATEDATYMLKLMRAGTLTTALTVSSAGSVTAASTVTGSNLNSLVSVYLGNFQSGFMSSSSGVIRMFNSAETDFNRLQFGGTTSAFPSLQRSGTGIVVRLADDSADAPLTSKTLNTPAATLTLGAAATTFAVTSNVMVITADAGGNTIATITAGVSGQILTLIFTDALTTITDDATGAADTINLSAAFTSTANDVLTLVHNGASFFEVSRSIN